MRFLRYGNIGQEKPAVIDQDGVARDISTFVQDISSATVGTLSQLNGRDLSAFPPVPEEARIGACVGNVGKFVCIGLNYADHAAETNSPIPEEPIIFMKATTAIAGPNDSIVIPPGSEKTDWEVELGVVIGTAASYVSERGAMNHVFGYCVVNDISERAYQLERGGQWVKGKGCDTFGPIGPWLVSKDEVKDPQSLSMWLDVDGHRYQDGSTKTMIFGVAHIVSYVSQFMTLLPGDVISTGTPPGVGMGQKPPKFLRAGQEMVLGIEGLGEQRQKTVAYQR